MTTLLRPSTRQIARIALRTASRPSALGGARIPRIAPVPSSSSTYLLPRRPRFYSTDPKPRKEPENDGKEETQNDKDGKQNDKDSKQDDAAPKQKDNGKRTVRLQLHKGFVWLEEKEIDELRKASPMLSNSEPEMIEAMQEHLRKHGGPPELQDILRRSMTNDLSFSDTLKLAKIAWKLSNSIAEAELFDSNQPPMHPRAGEKFEDTQEQSQQSQEEKQQQNNQDKQQGQRNGARGQKRKRPDQKTEQLTRNDIGLYVALSILTYPLWHLLFPSESQEISWQELRRDYLDKGLVDKLVVMGNTVRVQLNREATNVPGILYVTVGSVESFERHLDDAQNELGIPSDDRIPVVYKGESIWGNLLMAFGPTLLIMGLLYSVAKRGPGGGGGGPFSFGKSKAKMYNHESAVKVKFADVAGMDEAKTEIMEFVSFLKDPARFQRLGAKIPRGAVLSGPPGTGKTLLAKATAGESGVPFFSVSGSEFVEMFVGVGASRVRDLFAQARKNSPCIIFIDEIDAIGRSRADSNRGFGGNDEREATLNQILTEMDGFNTQEQIVVLAGTNRPDVLDKALMRPGRFDRQIYIDRPTMKGRADIFKVYLGKIVTKEDIEYLKGRLSALTPGFSGADIANAVNEAALVGMFLFSLFLLFWLDRKC